MEIYVKISLISMFSLILVNNHDFIMYSDFTRIAATNTTNYVTNLVTHRMLNSNL